MSQISFCYFVLEVSVDQGFTSGAILPPRRHLAISADIFVVTVVGGMLPPASSRQKLGMLLNIQLCPGQHLTAKNYLTPNVNPVLVERSWFSYYYECLAVFFWRECLV